MTLSSIVLAWSLAALAPTAFAQVEVDKDRDRSDPVRLRRMLIRQYDADRSGDLSDEEWERLREEMQSPRAETQARARRAPAPQRGDRRDRARKPKHQRDKAGQGRSMEYRRYAAERGSLDAAGASRALMAQVHMSREEMLEFDADGNQELDDAERSELRDTLRRRMEEARDQRFNAYVDRVLQGESPREAFTGRRDPRRHAHHDGRFARRGAPQWGYSPYRFGRDYPRGPRHFGAWRGPEWDHRHFAHGAHPSIGPPHRMLLAQRYGRGEASRRYRRDTDRRPERDRPSTRRRRGPRPVERAERGPIDRNARDRGPRDRGPRDRVEEFRRDSGPGGRSPDLQRRLKTMLERFDEDGDGRLSEEERGAIHEESRNRRERFRNRSARPREPNRPMRRRPAPPEDREEETDPAEIEEDGAGATSVEPTYPIRKPAWPSGRIVV